MNEHAPGYRDPADRRTWMAVLARSSEVDIEQSWSCLADRPRYSFIRPPEVGLVMVQARISTSGLRFHVGEATITRCIIQLASESAPGFGYVAGQRPRHAELVAVFDALLQHPFYRETIQHTVIAPLASSLERKLRSRAAEAATTKVEFFTLVRGEE